MNIIILWAMFNSYIYSHLLTSIQSLHFYELGLCLLCSKICLLCFLAFPQFFAYYARFYATPQVIMLPITYILFINIKLTLLMKLYSPP